MATNEYPATEHVREAYDRVMAHVAAAAHRSGRQPEDVLVVAVTKNASIDQIHALVEIGHKDLGEGRVQQLEQRVTQLEADTRDPMTNGDLTAGTPESRPDVRWHLVGHLQRNKIRQVVPLVYLIHSVDSLRLAEALHQYTAKRGQQIEILVQVNASAEPSKSGVAISAARPLIEQICALSNLKLRGLMTMAPHFENPDDTRATFVQTTQLFHDICDAGSAGSNFDILSMGMSNDYPIAIEEGANMVRIGRALFGEI